MEPHPPGADENPVIREVQVNSSLSFETMFLHCTVHPHHRELARPGRGEHARFVDDRASANLVSGKNFSQPSSDVT